MNGTSSSSSNVLCWPKRLLSAEDLRRYLTSQRELLLLPKTVITPLAADELRAKGVRIRWQSTESKTKVAKGGWIFAREASDTIVTAALRSLERDGVTLSIVTASPRAIAESLMKNAHRGAIVCTSDSAIVCCIANKIAGIRAAAVSSVKQASQARKNLGANLFAIEVPGPTYFELRQMLKTIVAGPDPCPVSVASTLKELDGHAHR